MTAEASSKPPTAAKPITVGEYLNYVIPGLKDELPPKWPPDVFGVAAAILHKSGSYSHAVCHPWPPAQNWTKSVRSLGKAWRTTSNSGSQIPTTVKTLWKRLLRKRGTALQEISHDVELCRILLELSAIADEACVGIGLWSEEDFLIQAHERLLQVSTLCHSIHPSRLRVLPKLHTPQSGLTIRSFSHNLALCLTGDITPHWYIVPAHSSEPHSLNLLLIPWPPFINPSQFRHCKSMLTNMPDEYGFFTCDPSKLQHGLLGNVKKLLTNAKQLVGRIDGVVFPEASLSVAQQERICRTVLKEGAFLIAGVSEPSGENSIGQNYVELDIPLSQRHYVAIKQHKHHRWKLEKAQIAQYGIGGNLDPERFWWESISIEDRNLTFVALRKSLAMSVLICEDLARQDPVAELVRAVGPNLVIAVLMDGPQLASRWSARYATVLADDPGCSVLTLTSIGMAVLSRPVNAVSCSRSVALWRDARSGGPVEITLPDGAGGLVLNLTMKDIEEWTADGRSDQGCTTYTLLSGTHPVFP
jgi:hypothetical protein